ncbi:MAG: MoxR family ATPase, partial [Thermodesulfovibrionales bacterium]
NPAKVMADTYQPEYFEKGPLTKAMEEGGILYIEEFNRMPSDVSNVLITPMEEGEIYMPRYGTVRAVPPFTVIAAQNPYDDVGTVRVSRAFMDRINLIKMDYQSEGEEEEIVRLRTGFKDAGVISLAVKVVRKTREHPDIKLGASVRAAIDLVDIFASLQKLADQPDANFLAAARMSMANRIWLNEITGRSPFEIVEDIWAGLKTHHRISATAKEKSNGASPAPEGEKGEAEAAQQAEKKKMSAR